MRTDGSDGVILCSTDSSKRTESEEVCLEFLRNADGSVTEGLRAEESSTSPAAEIATALSLTDESS